MAYEHLKTRRQGPVEYLTLNRPDVRNALNGELIAELTAWAEAISGAARRGELRAAVLGGAGAVFCAGADAKWMAGTAAYTESENLADAARLAAMFQALDELAIPLIARIQGAALGGGSGLAAVSDIAIAADAAVFGFTEVRLGIVPATISPFVLAKIGRSAARELFLTGMRFTAARAKEIGLVHRVAPADELDHQVDACLGEILSASPQAISDAKGLIREVWGLPARDAAAVTSKAIARSRASADGQEGLRAFLEKRSPSWRRDGAAAAEQTRPDAARKKSL